MSRESAVSAIERGDLSELQHVLEESEWDIGSDPLDNKGQTALHIACANGHLDIVQYLVNKKGCSVTVEDVYGQMPLLLAFLNKYWKVANFLLQIAPNSTINELESTLTSYNKSIVMEVAKEALATSCKEGYFELVKFLIKSGWYTVDHKTIISLARIFDNLHIVKYLLTHCQCTMPDDMSEVHIACIQRVPEKVKTALDSNGSSLLGTVDHYGTTPIHYATLEPNVLRMIVQYAGEMLLNITDSMGNTPLHHSIKYECIESVTILVGASGCDVNLANLKGETPLIAACKYSNSDIVQLLVTSEKCDLNTRGNEGNTPLHITISDESLDQLENVQCLLQSDKCDPNVINKSGCTPLHIACHRGNIPLLEALVADKRCNLNIQDGNGDTALHIGVENVEVVKCLLESGGSRCDIYNEKGLTPFHKAITNGVMASVEVMLKNGVNILQTTNDKFQNTPIHIACIYSRLDILKVLLDCTNCDPNQQDAEGNTALHIVHRMRTGRELQFLELLTSTPGINSTLVNHKGITPCDVVGIGIDGNTLLHFACAKGNTTMLELLVKNGADILKPNVYGDAPIHIGCKHSRLDILKFLLGCRNCDPNQQNASGHTALHIVCRMKTDILHQFLKVLLSTPGINPKITNCEGLAPFEIVDSKGSTLLHNACVEGNIEIVELLVKNGADVLKPDRCGDAPIHIACKHSKLDTLKVLLCFKSCDPNLENVIGDTPIHIVSRMKENSKTVKLLKVLVKNGADVLKHELIGDAPIHIACKHSRLDTLKVLLGFKSCDPNEENADGDTAIHIVSRTKDNSEQMKGKSKTIEFLQVLVKNGANVLKPDRHGDAPVHIACKHSRLDILMFLLASRDCDPNQQNTSGDTALHIVCRMKIDIVHQFLKVLLSTPGINPKIADHKGLAPFEIADSEGSTLLHNACVEGKFEIVELLVKNGADILKPNEYGDAPIHIACEHSRLDTLKVLLCFKSCDPNLENGNGDTPIHIVSRMKENSETVKLLELLVKNGADVLKHDLIGDAPIHIACKHSKLDTLKVLLCFKSCDPNLENVIGDTPIHIVSRMKENSKTVKLLKVLVKNGADVLKHDLIGDAPIHIACKHSRLDTLKVLLGFKSCDPNEENADGDTAIHIVSRTRDNSEQMKRNFKTIEFLQLLVKNGANVLKYDRHGDAPIHIACKHSRLDILKFLLGCRNCDPNQQNAIGDTALHIVCRMKIDIVLKALLSTHGINPKITNCEGLAPFEIVDKIVDSKGSTLLRNACVEGNIEIVELLVKKGADVLKPDRYGNAPIHIACKHSRLDTLRVLLCCKSCDPNQENADGDTPIHIVSKMKENSKTVELLELLVKNGADVLKPDRYGDAPIHIACKHSRLDTLRVLLCCKSCDPNLENGNGDTPIHIVSRMKENSKTELLELLVKNGADVLKPDRCGDAPIHIACKHSRLDVLKFLLGYRNCDPNQQNASGDTALHVVCSDILKIDIVHQFLKILLSSPQGVNPKITNCESLAPFEMVDSKGSTLLHNACVEGNFEIVELLVKNGADVLKPDRYGDASIHIACKHSRLDVLKFLLGCRNCDPNQQNACGDTALHIVCGMKIDIVLKALLSTQGINPKITNCEGLAPFEIVDSEGSTLLHNACVEGNFEIVQILVKNEADILNPNRHGDAPIHIACKHSRLDTLRVILDTTDYDSNQLNAEGDTALHIVCKMRTGRELQFLELLTSTPGINPTLRNAKGIAPCDVVGNDGNTLLHIACTEGSTTMVELLVKNGADVLRPDRNGDAPIHIACRRFKLDILKLLLSFRSCNPNQQSSKGDTALHVVCRMTSQQNVSGDTPLHAMCKMRVDSALQLLRTLISTPGIDPETVNHEDLTPIEVAGTNYSAIETIKKFLDHKRSTIQAYLKLFVVGNSGTGKSSYTY